MKYKERLNGTLAMGLLWTIAVCISYYLLLRDHLNTLELWMILFVSLLLLVCGLTVYLGYLGGIMPLTPLNIVVVVMEQSQSQFKKKEIASFMGISLVLLSYIFLLATVYFVFAFVFVAAVVFVTIYACASKRFRTIA